MSGADGRRTGSLRRGTMVAVALALIVAACGGDDSGISVSDPWSRATAEGATAGAIYMKLESGDGDALTGASVDRSIAAVVEIHETVMLDDEMSEDEMSDDEMSDDEMSEDEMSDDEMSDEDHQMDGAMTMREVSEIVMPAGEAVELAPGGFHVMLLDLAAPLVDGETFEVTLQFENAEPQVVEVSIRDETP